MADQNDLAFAKIAERTFMFTSERFKDKTENIGRRLELLAESITGKFFQMMAQRGKFIDVERNTGFAAASYPLISESLWDQKAKRGLVGGSYGGQNRFYSFKGDLERDLAGASLKETTQILGKSTFKGLKSDKFSDKQTVFRWGRGSAGGKGGQFGSIKDISATIEIDLFSKVNSSGDLNTLISGSGKAWAKKLAVLDGGRGGVRPIPARPLLAAYYGWFLDVEAPKLFGKDIGSTKWRSFSE